MNRTRAVAVLVLAAFALVGGLGLLHVGMDMDMHAGGGMHGCPFVGMTALCQMTPLEHIGAWQDMIMSLPWSLGAAALALALFAFLVFAAFMSVRIRLVHAAHHALRRPRRWEYTLPVNPLQELFSNGILHPRYF